MANLGYGTREKGIPTGAYGTIFDNPGTRTTDAHGYLDLRYEHTFSGSWDVFVRLFADRYTYQGTYLYPSPVDPTQISPNLDFADGKWWGTQVQVSKTAPLGNHITAGFEFRDNIRQDQSNYNLNPYSDDLVINHNSVIGGVYLQDEVALTPSLTLNAGVRYDDYSDVAGGTDPRAALIYRPASKTDLKFIYGEAFRIPNVYERYYSVAPNLPNPSLLPEKMHSTEFVWEQGVSSRLWLSTSAFHITMDGLITAESTDNGMQIFQNVQSDGIELELKGRLAHGFEGDVSYSFQEAKDTDADQFLNTSPRHLAKLDLVRPLLRRTLFVSANAQYRSGMTTFVGNSISPFAIVNLDLFGRRIYRHLDLSATLYNLLNKTYYDPPSTAVPESAIQQDGRTFRVQMTWHLGER